MVQDRANVTIELLYEVLYSLSNHMVFRDLCIYKFHMGRSTTGVQSAALVTNHDFLLI